jgi:hypothetical protein
MHAPTYLTLFRFSKWPFLTGQGKRYTFQYPNVSRIDTFGNEEFIFRVCLRVGSSQLPEHDGYTKRKPVDIFTVLPFIKQAGVVILSGYRFCFLVPVCCRKQKITVFI